MSGQSTGSREEDDERFYKKFAGPSARARKEYAAIKKAQQEKTEAAAKSERAKKRKAERAKSGNRAKKSRK